MRCYYCAVNNYPEECCLLMPLPVPPKYYVKSMEKRGQMAGKGILPPTLNIVIQTHYPLPVQNQLPVSPPSDMSPSPSPLPVLSLSGWGTTRLRVKKILSKHERTCFMLKLSLQRAGTEVEAPGQSRLSSREMQRTAVDGCTHAYGSSGLEKIIFFNPLSE